ncbi:MAG: DEAD/DEAH box helicase family protein [Firmicutes bacterium]|nr:DEAD/DEAH box helicase family protein [Bacillota bacterium]
MAASLRNADQRTKKASLPLEQRLVLQGYLLGLFGAGSFAELAAPLKANPNFEELDAENHTGFYRVLAAGLSGDAPLDRESLRAYDENIVAHTRFISRRRGRTIRWKYFQYLALLFTEIYLDRYFRDPEGLRRELNKQVEAFNAGKPPADRLPPYAPEDLRKVCFWMATGSGKTLIMHVNILQYLHYLRLFGREKELNRVLLLTPNPGLSQQHLEELHASGFSRAEIFRQDAPPAGLSLAWETPLVEILHIQRLREQAGETTVAVESFEGNNLVLVDEGHLGATGEDWMEKRDKLCAEGFSFEYSATFGQAMASSAARNKGLDKKYAKAILFDYSYRFFYEDGYGKDYRILNLTDDRDEETRDLYLTACLLAFYQQLRLYEDQKEALRPFNIEKPLCVFVGSSVQAVRTENRRQVSDVVDVLLFFAGFLAHREKAVARIARLLGGRPGLLDTGGAEIFAHAFPYLIGRRREPEEVYRDALEAVFNAKSRGKLRVEHLKGSEGELLLRVGDYEAFGLINVGDASALRKLCEEHDELVVTEEAFKESYFEKINEPGSSINLLIGSKKFTEGWNSWRVSTMGLMNIGRTEGSQIIQLFGRGVRLKGHGWGLKRSKMVPGLKAPEDLALLETLNVFGVRADYMQQFKEYLEAEGVPVEGQVEIVLPVIKNLGSAKLKVLRLKEDLDYRRDAPKPTLGLPTEAIKRHPVILNWYPRLQARQSLDMTTAGEAGREEVKLRPEHLVFLDWDAIYMELQEYKNERGWYNLNLPRQLLPRLFAEHDWYRLYAPGHELQFRSFVQTKRWQELVTALLKRYMERWYTLEKDAWERKHGLELVELSPADPEFPGEYHVFIEASKKDIIEKLTELKALIEKGELRDFEYGRFHAVCFDRHLYHPVLYADEAAIKVTPVALNQGEREFVLDLRRYYETHKDFFRDRELYLLRNQAKRGIGFFEAGNYYPDFVLWLLADGRQHVAFLDPKGLTHLQGEDDPKIRFHRTIKELEAEFGAPNLTLDAFILSVTPFKDVKWWRGGLSKEEFAARHVFFQPDDKERYIEAILTTMLKSRPVFSG